MMLQFKLNQIKKRFGPPDKVCEHTITGGKIGCYLLSRVEEWITNNAPNSITELNDTLALMQSFREICSSFEVDIMPKDELKRLAVKEKHENHSKKERMKFNSPKYIDRIMVNYIRHTFTPYNELYRCISIFD